VLDEETVVAAVDAPLLHTYALPPAAVRVTLDGVQKVVAPDGVMEAVGTVNVILSVNGDVRLKISQGCVPLNENIL
jgi:hypothetical protein